MDGTDFYYKRRGLGLTQEELADMLDVAERTLRRWEKHEFAIPDGVSDELDELHSTFGQRALETVDLLLEQIEQVQQTNETQDAAQVIEIASFNTPQAHARAHPDESWEYHKALIATVGMILAGEGYKVKFKTVTEEA